MQETAPLSPRNASQRDSPRREEILDELEAIFLAEGFRGLTVGTLAARLRCSRSTLYALAATKEELYLRVSDRILRRIGRARTTVGAACCFKSSSDVWAILTKVAPANVPS